MRICTWEMEISLPFNGPKAIALYQLIAKGLAHYHWEVVLPNDECNACAAYIDGAHAHRFDQLMGLHANDRVHGDLGNGTFVYEGVQAVDDPRLTIWRMSLYVAVVGGDPQRPGVNTANIYAFTAPRRMRASRDLARLFERSFGVAR